MLDQVRRTISRYGMFGPGSVVGVAVSGGADSVCLLHVLHELSAEYGFELAILHLNHMLRGEDSEADADFVRDLADKLGVPCRIQAADIRSREGNLEELGRAARLAFFRESRLRGEVTEVATGHTRSDQAETVLYRLLRGSGTTGLSGIQPVTAQRIVRPMIECSRADVLSYLTERNLTWREDHTNSDPTFTRNRIRHTILPLLQAEINPAVPDILAGTAVVAQDEEDYWAGEMERLIPALAQEKLGAVLIRADELNTLHPAVARRLLRRAVMQVRGDMRSIDFVHIERMRELAAQHDGHGRTQIPGLDIFRSFEWLRIGPRPTGSRFDRDYEFEVQLDKAGGVLAVSLPTGQSICLEIRELANDDSPRAYNGKADELDWELLSGKLEVRNWHPGDQIQVSGRTCQKLKTLFQEYRVPIWERQTWPILTSGDQIVWSRRFGTADMYQLRTGSRFALSVYETEGTCGPTATG